MEAPSIDGSILSSSSSSDGAIQAPPSRVMHTTAKPANQPIPDSSDPARRMSPSFECDTPDDGQEVDLASLLLPSGILPTTCSKFSISYSTSILQGWVAQPSPCCAAASVAGAFNALLQRSRRDPRALSHMTVLEVYREAWDRAVATKKASFERKLGGVSIDPVIEELEKRLSEQGESLMSKGLTRTVVMGHISAMVAARAPSPTTTNSSSSHEGGAAEAEVRQVTPLMPQSAWEALAELLGPSSRQQQGDTDAAVDEPTPSDNEDEEDQDDANRGEGGQAEADDAVLLEEEGGEVVDGGAVSDKKTPRSATRSKGGGNSGGGGAAGSWRWRTELHALVKIMGSRQKLWRDKPSTGPIGNLALIRAVSTLSGSLDLGDGVMMVKAYSFMGKRVKGGVKGAEGVGLSVKDTAAQVEEQWSALRSKFLQKDTVLIFHLRNHYALIFGLREWEDLTAPGEEQPKPVDDGGGAASGDGPTKVMVRQVLTARRAQRPTAWIDFDEVRSVLLGWVGYKIIALELRRSAVGGWVATASTPPSSSSSGLES